MKKLSVYLLLAATMLIPNLAFAESGEMSLLFNYGSLEYTGDYKKIYDSWEKYESASKPSGAFGLSFEIEASDRFALGIGLNYFGTRKMKEIGVSQPDKWEDTQFESSLYGRFNIINMAIQGDDLKFRLYGKAGLGLFVWDCNLTSDYYKGSGHYYGSDYVIETLAGYNYGVGAELVFSKALVLGIEYRHDATFDGLENAKTSQGKFKITSKPFEANQVSINVGLRFGGSGSSSSGSNWDSTASQNSFENPTINNNVQQVNNSGWGALGDNSNVVADAPTESVQPAETGVAAVKERSEEAMKELDQMSAKNAGTDPVLDKDKFLKKMDKIWNDLDSGAIKEEIAIPSFGILFKIGKSDILPYYNEMLNDFVDLYKKTDGNAKILIEGYSSNNSNKSTGRKSETLFNPSLSQQRVKAVAKYLVKEGIPASNLELKAYRNTKVSSGMFDNDPDCDTNCYRRVNISIK